MDQNHNERLAKWLKRYQDYRYQGTEDTTDHGCNQTKEAKEYIHTYQPKQTEEQFFVGFQQRFYAFVIDTLALSICLFEIGSLPVLLFIYSLYYSVLTASPLKGTLGKVAIGAVVVDQHGEQVTFIKAVIRFYLSIVSILLLGVGNLMVIFHFENRALHDLCCHTYVINKQWDVAMNPHC
ncbi:RDD family protein [Aquibacillus sediminis]|uniref:RDD family protein n=1 Tax=Aquibacillus sediminis TaxID=2574734 RepID=UPI00110971D8|nr:RDD family protein [Aquibacillus sediminis]